MLLITNWTRPLPALPRPSCSIWFLLWCNTIRGSAGASQGNLGQAISDRTEAIRLNPKDIDVYNPRGVAYASSGELDKAIADYSEAIGLHWKSRPRVRQSRPGLSEKGPVGQGEPGLRQGQGTGAQAVKENLSRCSPSSRSLRAATTPARASIHDANLARTRRTCSLTFSSLILSYLAIFSLAAVPLASLRSTSPSRCVKGTSTSAAKTRRYHGPGHATKLGARKSCFHPRPPCASRRAQKPRCVSSFAK